VNVDVEEREVASWREGTVRGRDRTGRQKREILRKAASGRPADLDLGLPDTKRVFCSRSRSRAFLSVCPVLSWSRTPCLNFACLYLILHHRPNGIISSIFPLFPPQYRPCPLRHWLSASTTVYLFPVTTTDVAHRGFHIRLGALLRRRRRQRRHEQLRIPDQSTPRISFIISHAHSHILRRFPFPFLFPTCLILLL